MAKRRERTTGSTRPNNHREVLGPWGGPLPWDPSSTLKVSGCPWAEAVLASPIRPDPPILAMMRAPASPDRGGSRRPDVASSEHLREPLRLKARPKTQPSSRCRAGVGAVLCDRPMRATTAGSHLLPRTIHSPFGPIPQRLCSALPCQHDRREPTRHCAIPAGLVKVLPTAARWSYRTSCLFGE